MVTKTVTGNGTGDYNCDGINDEVQINQALAWAKDNPQSTVWIKGPFTYDIQDTLLVPSYTTLELDASVKFRLKDAAAWAVNKPMIGQLQTPLENFEMYGGEIDGNYANQTEALNSGYYPFILFSNVTNLNIHDVNMHDGAGHGLYVTTGTTLIFHTNTVKNLGGDACYFDASTTCDIYSNNILVRGNSGVHIKNTANCLIHNNYINGLDDLTGGLAAILVEDTDGRTSYPVIYENVILDAYGSGILIQETGTGNSNRHKHCHVHHNIVRGCGKSQVYDFVGGCTVQGFDGAIFENNVFDSCYHAGFVSRYPSLSDGYSITCRNNTLSNTRKHRNSAYRYSWSGKGIANNYPTKYSMYLENNLVFNNEGGNYYGVNSNNDVPSTIPIGKYIPPVSYIQDEVSNYYQEGKTAYINGYPFKWQTKKISLSKSVGQEKPPGVDGWCIEDFGFAGAEISLDCYAYSLEEMRQVISAFYKPGLATLELGGLYEGYRISGITVKHSTDLQLRTIIPENAYPYNIFFLTTKPIMESNIKKIRTKKLTNDQDTWTASDCYPGNHVKNHNFHTWTQGNIVTDWYTRAAASDNNWTSACWAPAASGVSNVTVGSGPRRIAINSDDTKAYVSNNDGNSVSVITLSTNSVVTISSNMGTTPNGIGVLPDRSKVYVACKGSNNVKIITASSNTVTGTITTNIGTNPFGLEVSPNGSFVYVANYGASDISIITTSSNTATKLTVGTHPYAIAFTPDSTKAYVTNEGSDNISIINTATKTVIDTIPVGDQPEGIAITPDGSKAYVANYGSNTVSVITLATGAVSATIPVGNGPDGVFINSAGTHVYVTNNDSDTVSVITISTGTVSSTVSGFNYPTDCALNSTGTKLYVTNYGEGTAATTVTVVDNSNNGKYIAVANSGTANRAMTSVNGIDWTSRTSAADNNWTSVCYASSIPLGVAVANTGTGNRVMSTPDGVTWTARTSAADSNWKAVAYGGATSYTKFVAVADGGTGNRTMYSANGTTSWTGVAAALAQNWVDVVWAAGSINLWVAVSYTGTTQQIMTAPGNAAGLVWTARTTPISQAWTGIAYSPSLGMLACCSENGTTQQIMTSTNATGWAAQNTPETHPWTDICWDDTDGCFVCVASDGAIMASSDGHKWVMQSSGTVNSLTSICYSSTLKTFCAVANSGTGNRVLTCSDLRYETLHDTAPTDWDYHSRGQQQSDYAYRGINSYLIRGDGTSQRRGESRQRLQLESGIHYMFSGTARVQGLTQGRLHAGLYSGETELYGLDWESDNDDWETYEEDCVFDVDQTDLELRLFGEDYVNEAAWLWVDQIYIVRSKHYDSNELGGDIVTDGTVDVIPDIMMTATRLTAGAITEGFNVKTVDPTGGTYTINGVTYSLLRTEVLGAKPHKRHRIDKVRGRHSSDSSAYDCYTRVTYQCASMNGGAETQLCELRGNMTYPDFEDYSYSPYVTCGENESCTVRYYGRSEDSGHYSHHKDLECDHTEIITNGLGTGIQIYNTADPLTLLHVCNKFIPGSTMEINADGTGSFRYLENLADITYQNVCYSRTGDNYDQNAKLLNLAVSGAVIYRFDTRYPVTGIPFLVLDVIAGNPQIAIASEDSGTPGSYYAIDGNLTTDQSGQTIYRELNQAANMQLKGSTVFYVRIAPYTGQTCVINSLFLYADIVTIDAERPKIFATGQPNTFKVNMPNCTALEVSLQYRDAHRMI